MLSILLQAFEAWREHAERKRQVRVRLAVLLRRVKLGAMHVAFEGLRMHAEHARLIRQRHDAAIAAIQSRACRAAFGSWQQHVRVKGEFRRKACTSSSKATVQVSSSMSSCSCILQLFLHLKISALRRHVSIQVAGARAKQRRGTLSSVCHSWRQAAAWRGLKRRAMGRAARRALAGPFATWACAAAAAKLRRRGAEARRLCLLRRGWRGLRRHHAAVQAARATAFFQLATCCRRGAHLRADIHTRIIVQACCTFQASLSYPEEVRTGVRGLQECLGTLCLPSGLYEVAGSLNAGQVQDAHAWCAACRVWAAWQERLERQRAKRRALRRATRARFDRACGRALLAWRVHVHYRRLIGRCRQRRQARLLAAFCSPLPCPDAAPCASFFFCIDALSFEHLRQWNDPD